MNDYFCYDDDDGYGPFLTDADPYATKEYDPADQKYDNSAMLLEQAPMTLTAQAVFQQLRAAAQCVSKLTCFSESTSLLMLRRSNWLPEAAHEKYFADPAKFLDEIKVPLDVAGHINTLVVYPKVLECELCAGNVCVGDALALSSCSHAFCRACWRDVVKYKVDDNADLMDMRCPTVGCAELVGYEVFETLFSGPNDVALLQKIRRCFLQPYVHSSPRLRWCPNSKGCNGSIISLPSFDHYAQAAVCSNCNLEFCFVCGVDPPHTPATCKMLMEWNQLLMEEGPSVACIRSTTKPCPKCSSPIEKESGCNHITCTLCHYEFCWHCMASWLDHDRDFFECTVKDAPYAEESGTDRPRYRQRLLYHYDRYLQHLHSMKMESTQIRNCLLGKGSRGDPGSDAVIAQVPRSLLEDIKATLGKARLALAYSYVRSYYSPPDTSDTSLFAHQRGNLELNTENVSEVLTDILQGKSFDFEKTRNMLTVLRNWIATVTE